MIKMDKEREQQLAWSALAGTPGLVITSAVFDGGKLSPRIRSSVIKMLEEGYSVGRGEAYKIAHRLSATLNLGLRGYDTYFSVNPKTLAPEQIKALKDLCAADNAAYLLGKNLSAPQINSIQRTYHNNIGTLDGQALRNGHLYFYDKLFVAKAAAIVNPGLDSAQKEKRKRLANQLRTAQPFQLEL
jgi:hypothetical protein